MNRHAFLEQAGLIHVVDISSAVLVQLSADFWQALLQRFDVDTPAFAKATAHADDVAIFRFLQPND